ncbi:UPF0183 protein, partial [Mucuna pruriens]
MLTREYLDACLGDWVNYAPLRIAQLGIKKDLLKIEFRKEIDCHEGGVEMSMEFSDGTTLVTCRVFIYDNSFGKKVL